jgi:predicted secreted protein
MSTVSTIAIYALFWVLTAFVILPLGVKTHEELGLDKTPGQADSAPGNFRPGIIILRTTLLSAFLFGLYYANYTYGWIDRHSFDALIVQDVSKLPS